MLEKRFEEMYLINVFDPRRTQLLIVLGYPLVFYVSGSSAFSTPALITSRADHAFQPARQQTKPTNSKFFFFRLCGPLRFRLFDFVEI